MAELELIRVDKYSEQTMTHLLEQSDYPRQLGLFELCCATNMAYLLYVDGKLVASLRYVFHAAESLRSVHSILFPQNAEKGMPASLWRISGLFIKGAGRSRKRAIHPALVHFGMLF